MNFPKVVKIFLAYCFLNIQIATLNARISPKADADPIITAGDLGPIRGLQAYTINTDRPYVQFLGIQYGNSTAGENRFKPSTLKTGPLSTTGQPFNATEHGPECPQPRGGSENCLYLNIATPEASSNSLLPVIVFVHGAAFVEGNSDAYDGARLLKRDAVIVSFNYRLGVYGFFCLNTAQVPCNAGLHDSITALKWVEKYIVHFGGNPNLVTLAGQSSGSASVAHIMLSPLAAGLFHRVMTLSGTALNDWATTTDPRAASLKVAELVGCYKPSPSDEDPELEIIGACMKLAGQQDIINAQNTYQAIQRQAGKLGFDSVCPGVQIGQTEGEVFLPDHPINILNVQQQMNVPLMVGATKHDGAFGVGMLYVFFLAPNNLLNNATFLANELVPTMLKAIGIEDDTGGVYESISRTYLGDSRLAGNFTQMVPGLIDISTVFFFKAATYRMAQLHSRLNSTYLYSFDFKGTQTQHNPGLPFPGGVAHADDLIYVFPIKMFDFNEKEQAMSDALIDYWINFATTGNPATFPDGSSTTNPWPSFSEIDSNYLIIGEAMEVDDDYPSRWPGASDNLYPAESTGSRFVVTRIGIITSILMTAFHFVV